MIQMKQYIDKIIRADLLVKNKYTNIMAIPKIDGMVINMTIRNHLIEPLLILELISGQKGILLKAKKSVSSFDLRKGMYTACMVTLRDDNMHLFLYKLINIVIPRMREYRGLTPKSIDRSGNCHLSVQDVSIFPEIEYLLDILANRYGININILTSSKSTTETMVLLSSLQIIFKNEVHSKKR